MKKVVLAVLLGMWAATGTVWAAHYGVIVGLNKYSSSYGAGALNGCVPDANNIYSNSIKRGGWTAGTVTKLLDSAGTKTAIRQAVSNYAATAVSGDTFFYFQSSHGGQNSGKSVYLCTYNADYDDTELAADLGKFAAGVKMVVMVDACHSGGLFQSVKAGTRALAPAAGGWDLAGNVTRIMDENRAAALARGTLGVEKLVSASEIGWVTAADYNQYSWDGNTGGLFTDKVIEGWTNAPASSCDLNGDKYANFWELYKYASNVAFNAEYEYTTAKAFNTNVLVSMIAGWVGSSAPGGLVVFSNMVDQVATVGQALVVPVGAYTSGTTTPAVVTMTTVQAGASYGSGRLTFTPSADGIYAFNFTATNATGGSASATLTVNALLAAPALSAATAIGNDRFTANWTAVAGAGNYALDVATAATFSPGGSGQLTVLATNLNTGLATGWEYVNGASNAGTYHKLITATDPGVVSPSFSTVGFTNALANFSVATFGGSTANGLVVSYSLDGGSSWTRAGTNTGATASSPYVMGSLALPAGALGQPAVRVKWHCPGATGSIGIRLQNLVVSGAQPAGASTLVVSGQSVAGTSQTVTGLEMGTPYYWRVRAVGNLNGPYSSTGTVTTTAADSAPAFAAIAGQSATVGELFALDVSSHVSGSPAPALALVSSTASGADYGFAGGTLSFTPSVSGAFAFVFRASNALGVAGATVDVAVAAAPVYVPTASIANLSSNSFSVNWTATTGGSTYQVQVATDGTFSGGGSGESVVVATNAANTNVAPQGWTYNISASSSGYPILGYSSNVVQSPVFSTVGLTSLAIDFKARTYGGLNALTNTVTVSISTDGGSNWAVVGTVTPTTTTLTSYGALDASAYVGFASVCVKWQALAAGANKGAGIQALSVTGTEPSGAGSILVDETVAALTYAVTGLEVDTPYHVRVRATGGTWSEIVSTTTTAGGGGATPAPEPVVITQMPVDGNPMCIQIQSAVGVTYALQYTTNLMAMTPVWVQVSATNGHGGVVTLEDADCSGVQRFYRIVKP
jgi:hypothetical protein